MAWLPVTKPAEPEVIKKPRKFYSSDCWCFAFLQATIYLSSGFFFSSTLPGIFFLLLSTWCTLGYSGDGGVSQSAVGREINKMTWGGWKF